MSTWRDRIKVHPAADLFPMMSDDELEALVDDIHVNGLRTGVVLWTPVIPEDFDREAEPELYLLDGRNRLSAIELACDDDEKAREWEIERALDIGSQLASCPSLLYGDDDPYAYVVSVNIHRRHLTAGQRREVVAKLLKAKPSRSDRATAKLAGVSHPTVAQIRADLEKSGDVERFSTRTDTAGRQQPARKPHEQPAIKPSAPAAAAESAAEPPLPLNLPAEPAQAAPYVAVSPDLAKSLAECDEIEERTRAKQKEVLVKGAFSCIDWERPEPELIDELFALVPQTTKAARVFAAVAGHIRGSEGTPLAAVLEPCLEALFIEGTMKNAATFAPGNVLVTVATLERALVEAGIMPHSKRTTDPQGYVRSLKAKETRARAKGIKQKNAAGPETEKLTACALPGGFRYGGCKEQGRCLGAAAAGEARA